ncbi:MAG TPA: porin [Thermoanaerobaculia bacterium]|jgi:phosphate-selective porin OprO/OprP|nr:porin [Thermoanaerobaculia bacterium]
MRRPLSVLSFVVFLFLLAGPVLAQDSSVTAGKEGFSLRSADGDFLLKLRGYVQFDGRFFSDDKQKPGIDTFTLRRVRPIFEGTIYKIFDFRVMPDFGQGTTTLYDAYLEARFSPYFKVRAGKFKPPVGLERLQSATDILFVERALPTNLVPNRDLGIQVSGDIQGGVVSYAAGVFNGTVDLGNQSDADTNNSKDVEGRVFFQPFLVSGGALKNLGFGVAATSGIHEGTLTTPGLPSYRTPAQQTFFSYRSDGTAAGTVLADGRHTRFSPQGYFYSGPFGLLAEYVQSKQEVRRGTGPTASADLDHTSWQTAASWVLTGDEASFRGVNPKKIFDPAAHTWGAFELTARYSKLDLDEKTFPIFANPASAPRSTAAWAVGLNWYLNKNVRVMLDYEKSTFDGGAGTTSLVTDRIPEKILFSRFQISY